MSPNRESQTELLRDDAAGITRAAALLQAGELVAIPTETVYGLAADARNGAAVARIYAAKGRPQFNPLIVHVPDVEAARRIAVLPPDAEALADAFWPGPLTLLAPLREDSGIAGLVTAGLPSVALRVPGHPLAQAVLAASGAPLAAPSANLSGRVSPTTAAHVLDGLDGRIAAVLDGGSCPVGLESTIIGWDTTGEAVLLRPGGLPRIAIDAALGRPLRRADPGTGDKPTAPGQLTSHYATAAALRLDVIDPEENETYIAFGAPGPLTLSATGDLPEAAAALFDRLREADRLGRPIAVAPIPDKGLGEAINDRLRRAAAPR
ncbi:threonylcarbamoyl-AMP synthase [Paracoccus suum]|uniref:Threonylcarbamoyl-AMP synthase n=1 Tax=Paracoccus suum TaxID=2259340 RepID=A0A344PHB2_9RHOB|nr:L-threonylcarbamoyladenylate synthase [Paracoccus suum]AXC48767.1 threonylcarbamoyl-AMP synthase [Paracoccus suum]